MRRALVCGCVVDHCDLIVEACPVAVPLVAAVSDRIDERRAACARYDRAEESAATVVMATSALYAAMDETVRHVAGEVQR